MKPLRSHEIFGNWATLLLPINDDDTINYHQLADEIDMLISCGVNGIYSNGTAGEFYNQTEDEFDKIHLILAEKCNRAGMPFQIGCSHMSPKLSLERLSRSVELKPSAVQVILPDWFPPSMQEIVSFLKKMTDVAGAIGIVLYNPPHAKIQLKPEDFFTIKQAGITLAGCKVAGGDANWYAEMNRLVPELSLFIPGHLLATGLSHGAKGAYSNVACLNPAAAQFWYEMMLSDMEGALEQEKRIQLFMNKFIAPYIKTSGYSNQAVDKLLAAVGGWGDLSTRLRWPYKWIDQTVIPEIRNEGRRILPEFFNKNTTKQIKYE